MKAELGKEAEEQSRGPKSFTVTVNERPVTFSEHKVTGLELKQAAIKQGVAIQVDFVLFEVRGDAPLKQIGDGDGINLHPKQVFRAVAPDDNS